MSLVRWGSPAATSSRARIASRSFEIARRTTGCSMLVPSAGQPPDSDGDPVQIARAVDNARDADQRIFHLIEDDVAVHAPRPHTGRRVLLHAPDSRTRRKQIEGAIEVIAHPI